MQRRTLLSLPALFLGACVNQCERSRKSAAPAPGSSLLGSSLGLPPNPSEGLIASARDAAEQLRRVSGATFRITSGVPAEAVVLARSGTPDAPDRDASRLTDKGPEAFVIRNEGHSRIWIVANADAGLIHGLYFYLRELGCRWFLPNEDFTVLPLRQNLAIEVDRLVAPAFRMRDFFGTGAFGPDKVPGLGRSSNERWTNWKRRNGFGSEMALRGHSFEGFSERHRVVLEQHPEYRALLNGQRVQFATGMKLCVSNDELVALFIEDRLKTLEQTVAADPSGPDAFSVSVEPSDGGGYCECENCRRIGNGSPSDQTFHLANRVAVAVARKFPGRRVNLLAYAQHAAVPSIGIEPNVYVMVVPEAFQATGLDSEELLDSWQRKVGRVSCRAYWNIPDWTNEMPSFDFRKRPAERLRDWRRKGVEGVRIETSLGSGAMGLGLLVASRLLWDPELDSADITKEFFALSFVKARAPMQRLCERWAGGFLLSDHELGLAFADLDQARAAAAGDADVLRRVADYERYVHYVRLYYEYQATAAKSPERHRAAEVLVKYLYRITSTEMVATHRMLRLITSRYERSDEGLKALDPKLIDAASMRAASAISDDEIRGLMEEGRKRYRPLGVKPRAFSGRLVKAPARAFQFRERDGAVLRLRTPCDMALEPLQAGGTVHLEIQMLEAPGTPDGTVTVLAPNAEAVLKQPLAADGTWRVLEIPTNQPGRYQVHVDGQRLQFQLRDPKQAALSLATFSSPAKSPRLYFFVPRGVRQATLYAPSITALVIEDPSGQPIIHRGRDMITFDVAPGQDNQIWSLRGYKSREAIRMMNLPQSFALSPSSLLVPADALEPDESSPPPR